MNEHHLKKWASGVALIGLFMFSGVALFQLQVVFGWTNPAGDPPAGAGGILIDPATGNVAVQSGSAPDTLTVGGTINALNNIIKGVATPGNDDEAANKLYVDAAAGGQNFTIFGTASTSMTWNSGTGQYDPVTVSGGAGVSCPAGYGTALAGYGPHGVVSGAGWANSPFYWDKPTDPEYSNEPGFTYVIAPVAVAPTYSTCSTSEYQIVPTAGVNFQGGSADYYNYIVAKACENFIDNTPPLTSAFRVCNTCRICVKGLADQVNSAGGSPDGRWR